MINEDPFPPTQLDAEIKEADSLSRSIALLDTDTSDNPEIDWKRLNWALHQNYDRFIESFNRGNVFYQTLMGNNYRSTYFLTPEEDLQEIVDRDKQTIRQLEGISNTDFAEVFAVIQQAAGELPMGELSMFPSDSPDTDNILNFGKNSYVLQVFKGIDEQNYIWVTRLGSDERTECNFFTADLARIGFYGGQYNRLDPIEILTFFPHLAEKLTEEGANYFHNQIIERKAEKARKLQEEQRKEDHLRSEIERLNNAIQIHLGYLSQLRSQLKIPRFGQIPAAPPNYMSFGQAVDYLEQFVSRTRESSERALLHLIKKLTEDILSHQVPESKIRPSRIKDFLSSLESEGITPEQLVNDKIDQITDSYALLCKSLCKRYNGKDLWINYNSPDYLQILLSLTDPTDEYPAIPFIPEATAEAAQLLEKAQGEFSFGEFLMWGGLANAKNSMFEVSISCKYREYDEWKLGTDVLRNNTIVVKIKPKYKLAEGCRYPLSGITVGLQTGHKYSKTNVPNPPFGPYHLDADGTVEISGLYDMLGFSDEQLKKTNWVISANYENPQD